MGSKDVLPEQLFTCQQFSKVVPSAYDPWAHGEALKNL